MQPISESALIVLWRAKAQADETGFDTRIDMDRGDYIVVTPSFEGQGGQREHLFLLFTAVSACAQHEIRARDVVGLIESCLRRQGIEAVHAALSILAEVTS